MILLVLVAAGAGGSGAFTGVWLPTLTVIGAIAAVVIAVIRRPGEDSSRLYRDAMEMVANLQAQRAGDREEIARLKIQLEHAVEDATAERDARYELEREIGRLYRRIESLEARAGGRRDDDET